MNQEKEAAVVRGHYERLLHGEMEERYRLYRQAREPIAASPFGAPLPAPRTGETRACLPDVVTEAYDFYRSAVEDADLGSVRVFRVPLESDTTFAVHTTTDGDDGWLEVYAADGRLLGAARTYLELAAWGDRDAVRARTADFSFPPELADRESRTLWKAG